MKPLVVLVFLFHAGHQWDVVKQSKGEVWPLPQFQNSSPEFFALDASSFRFVYDGVPCSLLDEAFSRYYGLIFEPPRKCRPPTVVEKKKFLTQDRESGTFKGELTRLRVQQDGQCELWPYNDMDENYDLVIETSGTALLNASSVWGVLRGLETFSQLAYRDRGNNMVINVTSIVDYPRFSHRGVMLDTSRHYVSKSIILKNLDAMSYTKYNVFHWHIVDDPSFPYQSTSFPSLSQMGAFVPETHVYPMNDIEEIIEYARQRGIRVIAEFDTPSHVASWGPGMPQLLTQCFKNSSGTIEPDGFGPIDPSANSTYDFLKTLFAEIGILFPEEYLHIGGNDVTYECWKSNAAIQSFMTAQGFGNDYQKLQNYYTGNLLKVIAQKQKTIIVWQDVFDDDVDLAPETIVHVRKNETMMNETKTVTERGHRVLLSACWLLSNFQMANDWIDFYPCEPLAFNGTDEQNALVIGGEACMWAEFVDGTNLITRLWPRAFAPAERLWSNETINDHLLAAPRFEEHRCRLVQRGINAEPVNGPSFCPSDYLV